MNNPLTKLNSFLARIGSLLRDPLLLVIRGFWGWQFIQTGWGKLHKLAGVTEYFASLNIPLPRLNAVLASSTEFTCGLLLILGLFSRCASLALMGVMGVAYLTAENAALRAFFSDPDTFMKATPFLFLYAAVLIFSFGPGRLSLDRLITKNPKE
jgi:putative oxidoreductase